MPPSKRKVANKANVEKTRHVKAARAARAAQAARAEPEEQVRRSRSRHVLHLTPLAPRLQIVSQHELARFFALLDDVPALACHDVTHVHVHVDVPCLVETTTGFWIPEF